MLNDGRGERHRLSLVLSFLVAFRSHGVCDNVFKVKVLRKNEVILLIDVWVYISCETVDFEAVYKLATLVGGYRLEAAWMIDHIDLAKRHWKKRCLMVSS
jgi:hypothetical protein